MTAIEGFAGIHQENGILKVNPKLPNGWERMKFKIIYHGVLYQIDIKKEQSEIINLGEISC
jgi:kojibiose phosphorylase/nigerose phosphorylase